MLTLDPEDFIGRTFLLPPEENGERHRAKVTRKVVEISDHENGHRAENSNFILDIGIGEDTFEPFPVIAADDPVTCAAYAKQHDLLASEGWCRLRNLSRKDKVLTRAIKQSKIRQVRRSQNAHVWILNPKKLHESHAT